MLIADWQVISTSEGTTQTNVPAVDEREDKGLGFGLVLCYVMDTPQELQERPFSSSEPGFHSFLIYARC